MSNYQGRIREIQSAFVMGYQDRETCIRMFEELLHEHGLLPIDEQLDRAITNENFLALLKMARDHRVQPNETTQALQQLQQAAAEARNLIRDTIKQRCPVCQKPISALFNRIQGLDGGIQPIDPPRCQDCMTKWIEEKFGVTPTGDHAHLAKVTEASLSVDHSPTIPMRQDEKDFFAEYEKQMSEPLEP